MASTTNRTATVLVVKSNKTYYDALYYESSKLAEGKHSLVFLDLVESFNLIENLVSTRDYSNFNGIIPTIVVDAGEVVFLEELFKVSLPPSLRLYVYK